MKDYTVRDIAKLAGISKGAVRFRMRKIPNFKRMYTHKAGPRHTVMITKDGVQKLLRSKHIALRGSLHHNDIVKYLISQNDQLNNHINQLNKELNQEQELNLANKAQIKQLNDDKEKVLSANKMQIKQLMKEKQKALTYKRHGFFWRLFH